MEIETLAKIIIQVPKPVPGGERALEALVLKMAAPMMKAGSTPVRVQQVRDNSVVVLASTGEATLYSSNPSLHVHPPNHGSSESLGKNKVSVMGIFSAYQAT